MNRILTKEPSLKECPFCHNQLLHPPVEQLKDGQNPMFTLEELADLLDSRRFSFRGYGAASPEESTVRQSEMYHCYKCKRSLVLAYEQFL